MLLTPFTTLPLEKKLSLVRGNLFVHREIMIREVVGGFSILRASQNGKTSTTNLRLNHADGQPVLKLGYQIEGRILNFQLNRFGLQPMQPTPVSITERVVLEVKDAIQFFNWWLELPADIRAIIAGEEEFRKQIFTLELHPEDNEDVVNEIARQVSGMEPPMSPAQRVKLLIGLVVIGCIGLWVPWASIISVSTFPLNILILVVLGLMAWIVGWGFVAELTGWRFAYRNAVFMWNMVDMLPTPRNGDDFFSYGG